MILLVETHINRRRSRNFVRSFGRQWSGVFFPGTGRWFDGSLEDRFLHCQSYFPLGPGASLIRKWATPVLAHFPDLRQQQLGET